MTDEQRKMKAKDKIRLAQAILEDVLDGGVTYADFEAAQHAGRAIKRAARELRSVS